MGQSIRTKVRIVVAAAVLAVVPAAAASGDHRFSDQAGWDTFPVTIDRDVRYDIDAAADVWNRLAGRTILTPVNDGGQIAVVPSDVTWVQADYTGGPWTSCTIHLADSEPARTVAHEVGHCLGLADHIPAPDGRQHVNPGGCDGYRGLMSYCTYGVAYDDDIRAVAEATGGVYSRTVAIVNVDAGADALVAATLDADILFVTRDAVPAATAELLHLYDRAVIVGGEAVVSSAVEDQLGLPTVRLAGPDRVGTAAEVARTNEAIELGVR